MAATDVTASIVAASRLGADSTTAIAADSVNGNKFFNDGRTVMEIINGSGSSLTVTFTETQLVDGIATAGKVITVIAGKTVEVGPFPTNIYNDSLGFTTVAWSASTSITFRLTRSQ